MRLKNLGGLHIMLEVFTPDVIQALTLPKHQATL